MTEKKSKSDASDCVRVRGIVSSGLGKSVLFTEIPWVKKQFREKLGIDPVPGTFNVIVLPEDRDKLADIKKMKGTSWPFYRYSLMVGRFILSAGEPPFFYPNFLKIFRKTSMLFRRGFLP